MKKSLLVLPFLLVIILFSNCTKSNIETELLPNLNGVWEIEGVSRSTADGAVTPIQKKAETWTINGEHLEVSLATNLNYTRIASGNHTLEIIEDFDNNQFLKIDDTVLGEIKVNATELKINAGRRPNQFISHAARYTFIRNE